MVIDDFSSLALWCFVTDSVMGGVSNGDMTRGRDGDIGYVRLRGEVSTQNNGGFIQIRREIPPLPPEAQVITLRVRGNGKSYFMNLRTTDAKRPWHSYRAEFRTTGEWRDIALPLADFAPAGRGFDMPLNKGNIRAIGIIAHGRNYTVDVSVAQISSQ
jgi:hypothetical protein